MKEYHNTLALYIKNELSLVGRPLAHRNLIRKSGIIRDNPNRLFIGHRDVESNRISWRHHPVGLVWIAARGANIPLAIN